MLRIGEFSRHSQVSVKTLRYYDKIGLLKPAWVDRFTGYRYYSADQLPRLNRILALKDLGLSLDQIGWLLDDEPSPAEIRWMLRMKRAEIRQQLADQQARLARVEARLAQIEQGWLEARNENGGKPMRTCYGCGREIREPDVKFCPYCGTGLAVRHAPLLPARESAGQLAKKSVGPLCVVILLLVFISGLVVVLQRKHEMTMPSLISGPVSESRPPDPQLALLVVQCEKSAQGTQFVFEGKVQNISGSFLQGVIAVVSVYNADPGRIDSGESPIERTTLLPGQISQFRVTVDYDPTVAYYRVEFRRRLGDAIPTRHGTLG